jgi:Ran GTPase-activating protein (RanGAP) involved in mRNA processing and transport
VLVQCPALTHLDLSGNRSFRAAGAERLAGLLPQCPALTHLNLHSNQIGTESIAGVLGGAESIAGVLG